MKIELLYKEACNLYGDSFNRMFIQKAFKDATIYETSFNEEPRFVTENIDFIYLGSSKEEFQVLIIKKLMPYKDKLKEMIDNNKIIFATGNSMEIFGKYIIDGDKKTDCLGIFDYYAKRDMINRHNSLFLGEFNDTKIVGHKSQFSFIYDADKPFIKKLRGVGNNPLSDDEGYRYHNFFGTYLLGPFLVFNPDFVKYLKSLLNVNTPLPFEQEMYDAYNYRLKEFENPKTDMECKHS